MRTVYGNHQRFESTYFQRFPGYYMSGDGAKRDADGYLWITGRVDDMLNCSGHLMSTAQVESVLVEHSHVAEAAVVAAPHKVKGECLYCFVTPKDGMKVDDKVKAELKQLVRNKIAPFAMPDFIQVILTQTVGPTRYSFSCFSFQEAQGLPKTRSGKIMRRVLRKIAKDDEDLGDTSTLADPGVISVLQEGHRALMKK